jgi:Raf kinase inhibitor-like YbhB/YbcL family protein
MTRFNFSRLAFAAALLLTGSYVFALELQSPTLADGATLPAQQVFNGFGCSGENQSPALTWSDVPTGTKSFAITLYDPDAPTGSGWWHWVVFNIPADTRALSANAGTASGENLPSGSIQSRTDFGTPGFGGACPPEGDMPHRYQLVLHALDVESLPLDENSSGAMVGFFLKQHAIATSQLTWSYGR